MSPTSVPNKVPIGPLVVRLCLWQTVLMAGAYPTVSWVGRRFFGPDAGEAALFAGAVCWLAAVSALIVAGLFRGPQMINGIMLGMVFRMGPPLAVLLMMSTAGNRLVKAGLLELFVVYYLLSLSVETVFSIRLLRAEQQNMKAS